MMLRRLLAVFLVAAGASACGASGSSVASNAGIECDVDADCGTGACVEGFCKPKGNGLKYVMVEVSPPVGAGSGEYGQLHYLRAYELVAGGRLNIDLDVVADLTVALLPPSDTCVSDGVDEAGNLPIAVEVLADSGINGITPSTIHGKSDTLAVDGVQTNRVALSMAPGLADIYVVPNAPSGASATDPSCALAPILLLAQSILPGRISLNQRLPIAEHLNVDVAVAADLEGWTLDLVEPLRGRRISSAVVLPTPTIGSDGVLHHVARLAYHSVIGPDAERLRGAELVRLTPPASLLAPTFYVARSAVDLFGSEDLVVSQVTSLPSVVTVNGVVESEADGLPLRADVVATLEPSDPARMGALAKFQATTSTDAEGRFSIELLSGNYRVVAVPTAVGPDATVTADWTVAANPRVQSGRLLRARRLSTLTGVLYSEARIAPLSGATLSVNPSTFGKRQTFLDELLGQSSAIGVRSQMVLADEQGAFEIPVDAGRYDVAVRPAEGSGQPWAVRPNVEVEPGKSTPLTIEIHLPNAYSGIVTVPGPGADQMRSVLTEALLRFYALFDESGQLADGTTPAVSGVEIGHARTDATGSYRLLLPDRLD